MTVPDRPLVRVAAALLIAAAAPEAARPQEPSRVSPVVQVVQKAGPAVVNVSTEQRIENPFHGSLLQQFFGNLFEPGSDEYVENSLGSGVVIDKRGYVLTNEHVILRASRINVVFSDKRKFQSEVIGTDPTSDLAVLKVESEEEFPAVALGRSSDLLIGETVIAIGNPYGLSNTVTTGVVSAVKRPVKAGERVYTDFVQTDASINPGNSGGPLLNIKGELIGINTAIHSEGQGIGFAIPVDRARKVFEDLIRYGEVRVAWLGMDVRTVAAETAHGGEPLPAGAAIRRIYAGSAAERAGLAAGDVIVSMGDDPIEDRSDFDTAVSRLKKGDVVAIVYERGGSRRTGSLTAGEFPPSLAETYVADQIGVEVMDIPPSLRVQYPQLPRDGVIVNRVRARSRAAATGLEEGDVIRQINDMPIRDMAALRSAVPRIVGRGSVLLKVARGRFNYYVTLDIT